MSRFEHPNIVRLYDSYIEGEVLFILMEYAAGGSLYDQIVEAGKTQQYFDEKIILRWFVQIMLALSMFTIIRFCIAMSLQKMFLCRSR